MSGFFWVCDCQSALVRERSDGRPTVIPADGQCHWCGSTKMEAKAP